MKATCLSHATDSGTALLYAFPQFAWQLGKKFDLPALLDKVKGQPHLIQNHPANGAASFNVAFKIGDRDLLISLVFEGTSLEDDVGPLAGAVNEFIERLRGIPDVEKGLRVKPPMEDSMEATLAENARERVHLAVQDLFWKLEDQISYVV